MACQLAKHGAMHLESLEVQDQHCRGTFYQQLLCGVGAHHFAFLTYTNYHDIARKNSLFDNVKTLTLFQLNVYDKTFFFIQ
jgi:hypothetical protein